MDTCGSRSPWSDGREEVGRSGASEKVRDDVGWMCRASVNRSLDSARVQAGEEAGATGDRGREGEKRQRGSREEDTGHGVREREEASGSARSQAIWA